VIASRMMKGREKYPQGASFSSLVDEVGEVARVTTKEGGNPDRRRDELLDVIVVALRLYLGEEV
jgi:NTP pyrophosphatase (non-canonical NTP hydrolase)